MPATWGRKLEACGEQVWMLAHYFPVSVRQAVVLIQCLQGGK